jgi:hypothetical protein
MQPAFLMGIQLVIPTQGVRAGSVLRQGASMIREMGEEKWRTFGGCVVGMTWVSRLAALNFLDKEGSNSSAS